MSKVMELKEKWDGMGYWDKRVVKIRVEMAVCDVIFGALGIAVVIGMVSLAS